MCCWRSWSCRGVGIQYAKPVVKLGVHLRALGVFVALRGHVVKLLNHNAAANVTVVD